LKGQLPPEAERLVQDRLVSHSTICVSELVFATGRLDPADGRTRTVVEAIERLIDSIPEHRLFVPPPDAGIEAAVLAGVISRIMGYDSDNRRKAVADVTLFLQARRIGHIVLTRNVSDFDLLQQMHPESKVLFYRK